MRVLILSLLLVVGLFAENICFGKKFRKPFKFDVYEFCYRGKIVLIINKNESTSSVVTGFSCRCKDGEILSN